MYEQDDNRNLRGMPGEIDYGFLADREWSDGSEATNRSETVNESEAEDEIESLGDTLQHFADVAAFVNALYPDQMDLDEAKEAFLEGGSNMEAGEQ